MKNFFTAARQYYPLDAAGDAERQDMEAQIWEYLDGGGSAAARNLLEQKLSAQAEWRSCYEALKEIHQLLGNSLDLDHPSLRFTKNVMEEISKNQIAPAASSYINKKIIWGIASFFFIMILGFLIYGFGQVNWAPSTDGSSLIPYKMPSIEWSKLFNNVYANIFLMANVVLGLVVFDMYLGRKKKKWMRHHS